MKNKPLDGDAPIRRRIWENTDMNDPEAVGSAIAKVGVPPIDMWAPSWRLLFGLERT